MQCTRHKGFKWSSYITHSLRFHSGNHHDCSPYLNICHLRCNKSPARPWLTASEQAEIFAGHHPVPPATRVSCRRGTEISEPHPFSCVNIRLIWDSFNGSILWLRCYSLTDPNDNDALTAIIIKSLPINALSEGKKATLPRIQPKKVLN